MSLEDPGVKEGKPHFSTSGLCMHSHNYGSACFNCENIINYTLDYKILFTENLIGVIGHGKYFVKCCMF